MTALRTTIVSLSLALLTAAPALAGAPLATDDAGTIDAGAVEIAIGGSYTYDRNGAETRSATDAELCLGAGLYKDLSMSVAIPYLISERVREDGALTGTSDGFGDMTVDLKYAFAEAGGIALAIKPAITIPTGAADLTDGRWQLGATLIATREFAEGAYALHANLGYQRHNCRADAVGTRNDLWSGSLAGEMEIMKGLFAVADFGLGTNPEKAADDLPAYALTGIRYGINDHLEVNAGVKLGLTPSEDTVSALYGLVLKF